MLNRMAEFCSIADAVRDETHESVNVSVAELRQRYAKMGVLFKRIDQLEELVLRLSSNVDAMEKAVDETERHQNVNQNTFVKLKRFLFKRAAPQAAETKKPEIPDVLSVGEYFEL